MICDESNPGKVEQLQPKIHGDMTVAEILEILPNSREVLLSYGLHCVGCHANIFESLREGTLGHGMAEETFNQLLDELNSLANKKNDKDLSFSPNASKMINELIKQENKTALRIAVMKGGCAGFSYDFSVSNKKEDNEIEIDADGVKVFMTEDSLQKIKGSYIDYTIGLQGAGIKIDNPNIKSKCGCGNSFA